MIYLAVGESIICGTRSLHEVLEETHAEVIQFMLKSIVSAFPQNNNKKERQHCPSASVFSLSSMMIVKNMISKGRKPAGTIVGP